MFAYVIDGEITVSGRRVQAGGTVWSDPIPGTDDSVLALAAGDGEAPVRVMIYSGEPIRQPLVNRVGSAPADCADFLKPASGEAVLDGTPLTAERMTGDPIVFTAAEGNPVTSDGGDYEGTACGLWVTIPPPNAGRHTLTIRGESGDLSVSVDYTFEVRARQ